MTTSAPSLLGPLLAFAAVVALIPLALWLLKRTPLGSAAAGHGAMRVVATLPLAPNQRVVTVEVGSGDDRRWLVLGVTPGAIHTLHNMPPGASPDTAAMPGQPPGIHAGGGAFARLLARQQRAPGTGDAR